MIIIKWSIISESLHAAHAWLLESPCTFPAVLFLELGALFLDAGWSFSAGILSKFSSDTVIDVAVSLITDT